MKRPSQRLRNVVAILQLSMGSHRDILHGLSRSAAGLGTWRIRVIDYAMWHDRESMRGILSEWADGVVTAGSDESFVADSLGHWGGPLVVAGTPLSADAARPEGTAFVGLDEAAIGRAGADYLLSLGRFRSFGFVRSSPGYAGALRAEGFCARLRERCVEARVFGPDEESKRAEPLPMAEWFLSMQAPRAVMASSDGGATVAFAAAASARIQIPRDMALLGCDNDETICETTLPTLTSLAPDHVRLGEMAAAALRRIFADPRAPSFSTLLDAVRVVERQSARPTAPAAALVERAEAFIRRNADKGARVSDVVRHLGASRSLAALRFREATGTTMREAILARRLEAVKRKLRETDMSVAQVAASCGFRSGAQARRLFRARFGCSMRAWRGGRP